MRASLMKEIHSARIEAQRTHKLQLLEDARSGDLGAISHLRRSASQTFSEGSFIDRLGGQDLATARMKEFYSRKYSIPPDEPCVSDEQISRAEA